MKKRMKEMDAQRDAEAIAIGNMLSNTKTGLCEICQTPQKKLIHCNLFNIAVGQFWVCTNCMARDMVRD